MSKSSTWLPGWACRLRRKFHKTLAQHIMESSGVDEELDNEHITILGRDDFKRFWDIVGNTGESMMPKCVDCKKEFTTSSPQVRFGHCAKCTTPEKRCLSPKCEEFIEKICLEK